MFLNQNFLFLNPMIYIDIQNSRRDSLEVETFLISAMWRHKLFFLDISFSHSFFVVYLRDDYLSRFNAASLSDELKKFFLFVIWHFSSSFDFSIWIYFSEGHQLPTRLFSPFFASMIEWMSIFLENFIAANW